MVNVVIWGSILDYDIYKPFFELEIYKGNMQVVGLLLNEEKICSSVDGIAVVPVEFLLIGEYDYIINLNSDENEDILHNILRLLKVDIRRVIPKRIFTLPYFDLQRWLTLNQQKVSIFANQCWGGYASNTLGLQFLSPTVNMWFGANNFFKMLGSLEYYMNLDPTLKSEKMDPVRNRLYPVVRIGDVEIHMNHYNSFQEAYDAWNRRKQRINYDNVFIHAMLLSEEDIDAFQRIPFERKIGFTIIKCDIPNVYTFSEYEKAIIEMKYDGNVGNYLNHVATTPSDECSRFDLLKMLLGEKDFIRAY